MNDPDHRRVAAEPSSDLPDGPTRVVLDAVLVGARASVTSLVTVAHPVQLGGSLSVVRRATRVEVSSPVRDRSVVRLEERESPSDPGPTVLLVVGRLSALTDPGVPDELARLSRLAEIELSSPDVEPPASNADLLDALWRVRALDRPSADLLVEAFDVRRLPLLDVGDEELIRLRSALDDLDAGAPLEWVLRRDPGR